MSTLISLAFPLLLYIRAALFALLTKLLEEKKLIIFLDSTFVVSMASSLLSLMMMLCVYYHCSWYLFLRNGHYDLPMQSSTDVVCQIKTSSKNPLGQNWQSPSARICLFLLKVSHFATLRLHFNLCKIW